MVKDYDVDDSESISSNSSNENDSFNYEASQSSQSTNEWPSTESEASIFSGLNFEQEKKPVFDRVPEEVEKLHPHEVQKRIIFDSHCHLDRIFFKFSKEKTFFTGKFGQPIAVLRQKFYHAFNSKFDGCINVITNPKYFSPKFWNWMNESNVWQAVGCHPENAHLYDELAEMDLESAMKEPKVVALGEIGLDDLWANNNELSFVKQQKVS